MAEREGKKNRYIYVMLEERLMKLSSGLMIDQGLESWGREGGGNWENKGFEGLGDKQAVFNVQFNIRIIMWSG
jgi:hypothetical protein